MTDKLKAKIERDAAKHADDKFNVACDEIRNGHHPFYTTWRKEADTYTAGAASLLPIIEDLAAFVKKSRCKTYVGIVTPGREVRVHSADCKRCKALSAYERFVEGDK